MYKLSSTRHQMSAQIAKIASIVGIFYSALLSSFAILNETLQNDDIDLNTDRRREDTLEQQADYAVPVHSDAQVRLELNHLIDELAQVHNTGGGRKQYWITELLCDLCIINSYLPHDHTWTHPIDINKDVLRMLSDKLGMDNVKTGCCYVFLRKYLIFMSTTNDERGVNMRHNAGSKICCN